MIWLYVLLSSTLLSYAFAQNKWFILTPSLSLPEFHQFTKGDPLPIDCVDRRMDGGFKYDGRNQIIYKSFPRCRETNDQLKIQYSQNNEDFQCTILLTEEVYQMFYLTLHEDSPFSCRLPVTNTHFKKNNRDGVSIPLNFNFRGKVYEDHLEIDNFVNLLVQTPKDYNSLVSAVSWSSGTNLTAVQVGDQITIRFSIVWLETPAKLSQTKSYPIDQLSIPYHDGWYSLSKNLNGNYNFSGKFILILMLIMSIISSIITFLISSKIIIRNIQRNGIPPPNKFEDGGENGVIKKD